MISERMKGKKFTEIHKKNLSESAKIGWIKRKRAC
jgi:hypothetical protein